MTENTPQIVVDASPEAPELSTLDTTNPYSIASLAPAPIRLALQQHSSSHPDLFDLPERSLLKALKDRSYTPSVTEHRLRMKFWLEFDESVLMGRGSMRMGAIHGRICSAETFRRMLQQPEATAWLLCPPTDYTTKVEEALSYGLEQLREILDLEHALYEEDDQGNKVLVQVNTKLVQSKIKIVEMLDQRAKGAVTQKNLHLHATADGKQVAAMASGLSDDELIKRLKASEMEARHAARILERNLPEPEDVE